MATWYVGSTKYSAVATWAASTAYSAGQIVRQLATPAVGSERCFVCIVAGTSLAVEPTWVITKGAKTTEAAGPTWQECTARAGTNGDITNTLVWAASVARVLGDQIKNIAGTGIFICTTAGTSKALPEPTWNVGAVGNTTTDGTAVFTYLGTGYTAYAAPAARLNLILATGAFSSSFGDVAYVSNNHAETQSTAIAYQGINLIRNVICVNDSVVPPTTLATTGSVSTTGASDISVGYNNYIYGIVFNAGNGASSASINTAASATRALYESCTFNIRTTGTGFVKTVGGAQGYNQFRDCIFTFSAVTQGINAQIGITEIIGGSIAATGSVPTTTIRPTAFSQLRVSDCNMANCTGAVFNEAGCFSLIENSSLGSGFVIDSTVPDQLKGDYYSKAMIHNCDSASTNYRLGIISVLGNLLSETSIVRTGGASDGTTPISWQVVTNANPFLTHPWRSEEIAQWNSSTGSSKTASVEITSDSSLTNAQVWLEIEYLGDATRPLGSRAKSRAGLLATPVTLTTSGASWGGTALANKYVLSVAFTPQKAGPIKARIYVAAVSTTLYIDPLITVV